MWGKEIKQWKKKGRTEVERETETETETERDRDRDREKGGKVAFCLIEMEETRKYWMRRQDSEGRDREAVVVGGGKDGLLENSSLFISLTLYLYFFLLFVDLSFLSLLFIFLF